MTWQSNPFSIPSFIAAIILSFVVLAIWRRRNVHAASSFIAMSVAIIWWCAFNGIYLLGADVHTQYFWAVLQYPGIVTVPVFWLMFALEYTGQSSRVNYRNVTLLLVYPLSTLLLAVTNSRHYWMWSFIPTQLTSSPWFTAIELPPGPNWWGMVFYSYTLIAIASLAVLRYLLRSRALYKRQAGALLVGIFAPWVSNVIYVFHLLPIPNWDLTPLTFALSGVAFAWALFNYHMFDIIPIANDLVIQNLPDAVFVIDQRGRIVNLNPSALQTVNRPADTIIGQSLGSLLDDRPDLLDLYSESERLPAGERIVEIQLEYPPGTLHFFEARLSTLYERRRGIKNFVGRLLILRDITERKQSENDLHAAHQTLQAQLEEIQSLQETLREQALRDPLTDLYNRRYLTEAFERDMVRVRREHQSLSVLICDIDHFKHINDTYGHQVGDEFLVAIADLLRSKARRSDIVCRYGGEEFLMVLPGTALPAAFERAEGLRRLCARITIPARGRDLSVTLSFGVASFPDHSDDAEEIIIKADNALYRSKRAGRDCTTIWSERRARH